jgi:hypothetical protein
VTPARRRAGDSGVQERIVFRGPPDNLATLFPAAAAPAKADTGREPEAKLLGAEVRGLTVRAPARAALDVRRATLRLLPTTPPGTYEGSAEIEGRKVPIVAEVERRPRLEAEPRRISVEAGPGEKATADVTLLNTGNVACDISGTTTFGVLDGSGAEHAFWAALGDVPEGKKRIDVFMDDLASFNGGVVTTSVDKGSTIEPGEARDVRVTLRFSDRLEPGRSYDGAWESDGLRIPVRITTPATKPRRAARAAE